MSLLYVHNLNCKGVSQTQKFHMCRMCTGEFIVIAMICCTSIVYESVVCSQFQLQRGVSNSKISYVWDVRR